MTVTNKPSATLVIGCHRSGTSLITRCLSAMGLTLADDLIPAQPDNPKGFWEDAGVTAFNESLLNAFQCDWNSVNFAKLDNIRGQRVNRWREKARVLIQDHYPADSNFVIKDPKFSLLIPFWQEVFDELEIDTRYLLTYRPPLSVAASLKARNGFSREKSVLIWLAYNHACLKSIPKASPVSVVSYDLFMQHPVDQSKRIQRQLGIDNVDWPSISTFLNDFPDPSLRHHQADGQVPLPGFTRGLMEHLEHLCCLEDVRSELRNSRHAVVDEERLNRRLGEFITDDRFRLNLRLRAQNEQYEQRVTELTGWKQEAERVSRERSSNTKKYELHISRMLTELATANNSWQQEVDSLNSLMAEKEVAFNQEQQRLNAELAESNTDWQQEVDSLNSLMVDKDQSARSELDSLNQLLEEKEAAFNQEQQRLTEELTAANSAWQQEVDQLNSLMHDKDQSARSELNSLNQLLEEKEAAFNQEQQRLNAELADSNTDWQQEVDSLNSLMVDKDQSARSELDSLNQLLEEKEAAFNQEQQRLTEELTAANSAWQQEVDQLNSLMHDKDQSARSELNSLNQLLEEKEAAFNQEQQRLNAELADSNTDWQQEVDSLNSLMVDKDQSARSELDSLNQLLEEKQAAFNQEQQRLNAELADSNTDWQQEVDSLNSLMVDKDQSARSELDSLNQLLEEKQAAFNQEQQRLNAELAESNTIWKQEVDQLNSLMHDKDQSAQSELDSLNQLLDEKEAAFNEEQQRLNAELAESNTIWKQEVDQLKSLMHDKDQSAQSELDSLNQLLDEKEAAFNEEQQRLTEELTAANSAWQQEVDSLNNLMVDKDQSARSELDSLNQLLEEKEAVFNQEQQRLNAELAESNTIWKQEVDQLNSLMHDKDQSAQSELDSLNQLLDEKEAAFNEEQQRLNAELSAAKTEWQQEVDSLNSLMIEKDQTTRSELDQLNHLMEEKEATFNQEQQRLNAELNAAKTEWQQEVDSLNSLMIEKDQTARSELDQLNHLMEEKEATFNQEQQRLNAELNAAKTEWQQEVDSLNSLMNDKDQSAQSEFDRLNHLLVDKEAAFNQEQQRLNAELAEVRRSYSYRLGRFITWPVRKPFVSLVLPLFRNRHTVRLALTMAGQALRHPLNGLKLLSLRRIRNTMVIVYRRPELGMQVFGHYTDQLQGENQRPPALPVSTGTEIKGEPDKISLAFELPEEPRVSVIIPVYNQLDFTLGCLQSIVEHKSTCSFEIIVADDCSTDDTGDVIPPISGIRYIRNPENLGFIRSCNHASEHARGEFVFFLNNDTQVTAGWLDSLVAVFDQHRDAGIVGSRLLFPDGKLQEAGGIVWDDASGWNFGRLDDPEKPEFNYLKEVDYVSGAALMIRRSLLTTLGRFDERFVPAYYEDTDLAFAVRDAGYKVFMQPRSNIVHFEGVTNGTETGSGIKRYQVENQVKFLAKWQSVLSRDHFPNAENLFLARDRSRFKTTVLVVDHYVPHYDRDAGSRSTWQYLQLMVSAGFNVKFIGDNFFRHEPYATELENMGIEVLCGNDYAQNWQQWIIDNAPAIDIIYLQRPHISENYIPVINQLEHRPKTIYFGHDLHFLRLERQHEVERDPQLASEAAQWKQREFDIFHQVDLVYYPSEVEVSRIKQEMPQAQVKAIPLYIFEEDGTEDYDPEERKDLLFVGGFNHTPNVDAVKWFIQQVFPQVTASLPDVKLHVVGSNMPADINDLGGGNVIMHGFLEDEQLDALYSSIRLSVVPLRYGAGVKGKVLESMHKGVPVVTTSIGAEGIPQAEDCMCVSSIEDYGASVIRLYQDHDELNRMSNSARLLISEHFSLQAASDAILDDFV